MSVLGKHVSKASKNNRLAVIVTLSNCLSVQIREELRSTIRSLQFTQMVNMFRWLVTAYCICLVFGEEVLDPRRFCSLRATNLYPHPEDCSQFIVCSNGYGYLQSCPDGMTFNQRGKVCDYSRNNRCNRLLHQDPRDHVHVSRDSKDKYRGHNGISSDNKLPSGYGNRRSGEMVHSVHSDVPFYQYRGPYSVNYLSGSTKPDGYNVANNGPRSGEFGSDIRCTKDGLFPHPTDCNYYINCALGHAYITRCPSGTYFIPYTQTCGYDDSACGTSNYGERYDQTSPQSTGHGTFSDYGGYSRQPWVSERLVTEQRGTAPSEIMDNVMSNMEEFKAEVKSRVVQMFEREARMARKIGTVRRAFGGVQAFLGSTPYVKQLSVPAFFQLEALRMIKARYSMELDAFRHLMNDLPSLLKPNPTPVSADMPNPRPVMDTCPYPRNDEQNGCNPNEKYRSYDGSCNNINRPLWGKSMRPLARFLPPDYADGIGEPRVSGSGHPLPSARAVSLTLFEDRDHPSHVHTLMHMTYGQFLDHDLSRAAVTKLSKNGKNVNDDKEMVDVKCGDSECETTGFENRACFPIELPYNDPVFSRTNKSCLMFVRTQEVPREDCKPGPREQINQLTSYIDASMVYGSTKKQAEKLRDKSNSGKLLTTPHPYEPRFKPLQPTKNVKDCRELNTTVQCFTAGDGRLNEHVGLTSIHTIFTRAHNNFVDKLKAINPHWSGERLYQEARRIMGAAIQFITYNEYLPLVFGPSAMDKFGLTLVKDGYFNGYDPTVSTDITNSFTTAAFRFGHSQIDNLIRFAHQQYSKYTDVEISTVLRRPAKIYDLSLPGGSGIDSIILGHISQPAQISDRFFAKEMTAHLFSENPPYQPGTDLPALNVQRGRDHGLPNYNAWRLWCGLPVARDFDDLVDITSSDVRERFRQLYRSVDDIDLYAGAITERHLPGGMVGPTFGCILGRQFRNLKVGDRFWHERRDPVVGFSYAQLKEIRKFSLARIFCDNLDKVDEIQKFVMLQPISEAFRRLGSPNYAEVYSLASLYRGHNNERRPCSDIPDPDFSAWIERPAYT